MLDQLTQGEVPLEQIAHTIGVFQVLLHAGLGGSRQ